ncbi:MAG: hypothetical protein KGR48_13735 [Alphaproteobacteria bacterium]|nr:hypothetical protein [Alphaproteobacteria bacterium]
MKKTWHSEPMRLIAERGSAANPNPRIQKMNLRRAKSAFVPLGISVRAIIALFAAGIHSRRQLHALSEQELSQIRGIGTKTVRLLRQHLRQEVTTSLVPRRPQCVRVLFAQDELKAIDQWISRQQGRVSRTYAIRRLVNLGLRH